MSLNTNPTRGIFLSVGVQRIELPVPPQRDDYAWDAADGWQSWHQIT